MLLVVYISLCLFVIHSALLMSSKSISILAIGMLVLLVCAFFVCLLQVFLIKGELRTENGKVTLYLHKRGILPLYLLKTEFMFTYDQSGERDTKKDTYVIHSKETAISLNVELKYAGSGRFVMRKCSVSDFLGLFSLPLYKKNMIACTVDLLPPEQELDFYTPNNRLTGTVSDNSITVDMIGDDPSETLQIREYRPGDLLSRTHWKLSAKREDTMIRELARESDSQYLFVLSFVKKTQESFHHIVANYFCIAQNLLKREMNHVVLWSDPDGEVYEEKVNTEEDLEETLLLIYHSFDHLRKSGEAREKDALLTPYDGYIILEEYEARAYHIAFIKRFVITDEPLEVIERRWSEDEE